MQTRGFFGLCILISLRAQLSPGGFKFVLGKIVFIYHLHLIVQARQKVYAAITDSVHCIQHPIVQTQQKVYAAIAGTLLEKQNCFEEFLSSTIASLIIAITSSLFFVLTFSAKDKAVLRFFVSI